YLVPTLFCVRPPFLCLAVILLFFWGWSCPHLMSFTARQCFHIPSNTSSILKCLRTGSQFQSLVVVFLLYIVPPRVSTSRPRSEDISILPGCFILLL
ncbi:hypothetical protein P280DRAFT_472754, partial [Massarina eburnea CBS 473.64]